MTAVRDLLGALDHPMMIVTTAAPGTGERSGCLVGFASQCSIHPARFTVWLSDKNHTYRVGAGAPLFAVHFPAEHQHDLAAVFGSQTGDEVDKFAEVSWTAGPEGVPLLDDVALRFVGRVFQREITGDHAAFLLDPLEAYATAVPDGWRPLLFSQVQDLEPGHPA